MVALKQSCCRKTGVKKKNSNDHRKHRKTGKPERRLCGCEQHIENQTVHGSALFFVVQGETERGCLRNKLSDCPKMMGACCWKVVLKRKQHGQKRRV